MTTSNLSELTETLKTSNKSITVNVVAEPEKEVINTISKGDSDIVKSLNVISTVLMQQFAFQKEAENRRRLEQRLIPKDIQQQNLQTASREGSEDSSGGAGGGLGGLLGGYGLFRMLGDAFKGLIGIVKKVGGVLLEFLGIDKLFGLLKEGFGSVVGKLMEFSRALAPLALRFAGLAGAVLTIGEAFKGLEKIIEDTDWYKKYSEWAGPKLMEGARSIGGAIGGAASAVGGAVGGMFESPSEPDVRTGPTIGDPSKPGGGGTIRTWDDISSGPLKIPKSTEKRWEMAKPLFKEAAKSADIDPGTLARIGRLENPQFDPMAGPKGLSSAKGYGQFTGGTWRATVKEFGSKYGLDTRNPDKYRYDPKVQAQMFAELTKKNLSLGKKYGGNIEANAYAIHNLGEGGAGRFFEGLKSNPNAPVSTKLTGKEITNNRINYMRNGRVLTFQEAYEQIQKNLARGEPYAKDIRGELKTKEEPSTTTTRDSGQPGTSSENLKSNYSQNEYKEALSFLKSRAGKGDDVWNLDADYAVKLSRGMKKAEERFGEKVLLDSGFRVPTDKQKRELGSTGSSQEQVRGYRPGKLKGIASVYGSMHGMGGATDVRLASRTIGSKGTMNKLRGKDREDWIKIMEGEGLDVPMRPDGSVPSEHELWHIEQKGLKRGGAAGYGLKGQEYTDYIKSRSLQTAVEKGAPTRAAIWEKGEKKTTYAKMEKQLPEGGKYKEEESEMEETNEPVLSEKTNIPDVEYKYDRLDKQVKTSTSEQMLKKLDEMNSHISDIKDTNRKMADIESSKQSDTATKEEPKEEEPKLSKQDEEAQKTMDDLFSEDTPKRSQEGKLSPEYRKELEEKYKDMDPAERELMIQETEDALNRSLEPGVDRVKSESPGSFKVDVQKPSYSTDQVSKENDLIRDKGIFSNTGTNPFGGILKPTGGGIFNTPNPMGTFGQNPFGTIQGVLGTIGSTVSMGQQIGNMGRYGMGGGMMGGIGAAQGAIGGIQGVLGQIGQQSPTLGGLGQVLGGVGSVMGSIEGMKNAGRYGMGGGILGGISAASGAIGAAGNIYNAVGGLGSVLGGMMGDDKSGQATSSSKSSDGGFFGSIGDTIGGWFGGGDKKSTSSFGAGDDIASVKSKYETDSASLVPTPMNDGMSLESTTTSVQSGKEEMMTPQSAEPTVVPGGGGGGGGGAVGGGGNNQANPSSSGVMGIDIGVRNEEATLLRAQFGSVRIV